MNFLLPICISVFPLRNFCNILIQRLVHYLRNHIQFHVTCCKNKKSLPTRATENILQPLKESVYWIEPYPISGWLEFEKIEQDCVGLKPTKIGFQEFAREQICTERVSRGCRNANWVFITYVDSSKDFLFRRPPFSLPMIIDFLGINFWRTTGEDYAQVPPPFKEGGTQSVNASNFIL